MPPASNSARMTFNALAASIVTLTGVPGFFTPRIPSPLFDVPGTRQALSFYDTEPLRKTLLNLIDFDLINARKIRLSVGTVNVTSGNFAYFDNTECEIGPEHIMASGALPPGFPPIEINGEFYWDGGLASNTPLGYVLEIVHPTQDMCIFQVDLFSATGLMPKTIYDVLQREKDIRFSSRTRMNTDQTKRRHEALETVRRLLAKLPEELRDDADAKYLAGLAVYEPAITIVHLIHRVAAYETQAKDYEFSRVAVNENWAAGAADVCSTLENPRWKHRKKEPGKIDVLDLATLNPEATRRES